MTTKKEKKLTSEKPSSVPVKPSAKKKSVTTVTGQPITKRLATEKHPTIQATINDLFRFEKKEQAEARVQAIKDYFVTSVKLPKDSHDQNVLKLWIRGYMIDEEEEKQGYLGNYAAFRIIQLKDKKFTIRAEKQKVAIKYHPQRERPKRKHPDWGHPALRLVKKAAKFDTIEAAAKIIKQLHAEYPEISIPTVNKLFIIIYSKAENPEKPIQKYVLEIKPNKTGGFFIEYKINDYDKKGKDEVKKATTKIAESSEGSKTNEPAGYFTSMVALKRDKKAKISDLRKKKQEDDK